MSASLHAWARHGRQAVRGGRPGVSQERNSVFILACRPAAQTHYYHMHSAQSAGTKINARSAHALNLIITRATVSTYKPKPRCKSIFTVLN